MIKSLYFAPLVLVSATLIADPFYADPAPQAVDAEPEFAKSPPTSTACSPPPDRHTYPLESTMEQLKLVGIVQLDSQFVGLFLDKDQRLIDLKVGDLLIPARLEIEHIDLKHVELIDWLHSENCTQPQRHIRKL